MSPNALMGYQRPDSRASCVPTHAMVPHGWGTREGRRWFGVRGKNPCLRIETWGTRTEYSCLYAAAEEGWDVEFVGFGIGLGRDEGGYSRARADGAVGVAASLVDAVGGEGGAKLRRQRVIVLGRFSGEGLGERWVRSLLRCLGGRGVEDGRVEDCRSGRLGGFVERRGSVWRTLLSAARYGGAEELVVEDGRADRGAGGAKIGLGAGDDADVRIGIGVRSRVAGWDRFGEDSGDAGTVRSFGVRQRVCESVEAISGCWRVDRRRIDDR